MFILGLRAMESCKNLSVEGKEWPVSGGADSDVLCVIVIDDLGGTVLSSPSHGMSLLYLILTISSARFLCIKEYSEK